MVDSVLGEKSFFKMLQQSFSSKLDWGYYTVSIAKTASKKIGVLICSINFISPTVNLDLYRSTIWPCMEYSWNIAVMSRLVLILGSVK